MAVKLNYHFKELLCPDKEAYLLVDHLSWCIQESKGQQGKRRALIRSECDAVFPVVEGISHVTVNGDCNLHTLYPNSWWYLQLCFLHPKKKPTLLMPLPKPPSSTWGHTNIQKMTTFCNFPRTQAASQRWLEETQPSWGLPNRPLMSWQVDKLWIQMLHSQTCIWTYIFLYSSIQIKYFFIFTFTFCFFGLF